MSTRWRCAICEAMNDGGETCAACGAKVTHTVVQPTAAEAPSTPERARGEDVGTEIPVRELPRRRPEIEPVGDGPYEVYDVFGIDPTAGTDTTYESYEPIDTRPRIRVYGCCLPIALSMLLAVLGAAALLINLAIGVL
jgi:hypothetical protein